MQRVAIFQFKRGQHLALLFMFALSVIAGALLIHPANAGAVTFKTEASTKEGVLRKVKAIKYYDAVKYCVENSRGFSTEITGTAISKGPRWWTVGKDSSVTLGQFVDTWGDKNGTTACNGESDSEPGWINDLFSVYGLDLDSDKKVTLAKIGYSCKLVDSDYKCTNNDINSTTSPNGLLAKIRNSPYLKGNNPFEVQPDYGAMSYVVAMHALKTASMCKASPGGSSGILTVATISTDGKGSIVKALWGVENDGGVTRPVNAAIPLDIRYGTPTCQDAADSSVANIKSYLEWTSRDACAKAFPAKASDEYFIIGCSKGSANQGDYNLCATLQQNDNEKMRNTVRNACFLGQGLPKDVNGTSSGIICYDTLAYTSSNGLSGCINGSLHTDDPTYCTRNFAPTNAEDVKNSSIDRNKEKREACLEGQKLAVSGGLVPKIDSGVTGTEEEDDGGDTASSCAIEGMGWIVCPAISFLGDMMEVAFQGLADNFLKTDAQLFNTESGTYIGWGIFRSLANIAFVIVFLIIIFSQLSGVGVTNYGVKKMLPRLVIAAILVNVSFFVCQLAVDLSNILGYSLKTVFDNIATSADPTFLGSTDASANGVGIAVIVAAVLAAGVAAYFSLSILVPVLIGALVSVLMIVLILILRKALIVLLIVISPLAFVAFLLPNTESLFTKWRKAFVAMLLVFPIVSIVFGAASLASQILLHTDPGNQVIQIAAVGVAALPFFVVPGLLKSSLDGIGNIGGKISGAAGKIGSGAGKLGSKGFANTALSRGREHRKVARAAYRDQKFAKALGKEGGARGFAARGLNLTKAQRYANQSLERKALLATEKAKNEDIEAAGIKLRGMGPQGLRDIAHGRGAGSDPAMRAAAIKQVVASNDVHGMNQLYTQSRQWDGPHADEMRSQLAQSMRSSSSRPGYFGMGALADLESNTHGTADEAITKAVTDGVYSAEKISTSDKDELAAVAAVANANTDPSFLAAHQSLVDNAHAALTDPKLSLTFGKNKQHATDIMQNRPPTAPLS